MIPRYTQAPTLACAMTDQAVSLCMRAFQRKGRPQCMVEMRFSRGVECILFVAARATDLPTDSTWQTRPVERPTVYIGMAGLAGFRVARMQIRNATESSPQCIGGTASLVAGLAGEWIVRSFERETRPCLMLKLCVDAREGIVLMTKRTTSSFRSSERYQPRVKTSRMHVFMTGLTTHRCRSELTHPGNFLMASATFRVGMTAIERERSLGMIIDTEIVRMKAVLGVATQAATLGKRRMLELPRVRVVVATRTLLGHPSRESRAKIAGRTVALGTGQIGMRHVQCEAARKVLRQTHADVAAMERRVLFAVTLGTLTAIWTSVRWDGKLAKEILTMRRLMTTRTRTPSKLRPGCAQRCDGMRARGLVAIRTCKITMRCVQGETLVMREVR
jgi:hypothetical protein